MNHRSNIEGKRSMTCLPHLSRNIQQSTLLMVSTTSYGYMWSEICALPFILVLHSPYLYFEDFFFIFTQVSVYLNSMWSSEEGIRTRVTSNAELPEGGSENQTNFLWKVIKCSQPLSHLSRPQFIPVKLFIHLHLSRKSSCSNNNPNPQLLEKIKVKV